MKGIGRREVVPFSYSIQIIRSGSQIRDFGAVDIVAIHFLRGRRGSIKDGCICKDRIVSSGPEDLAGCLGRGEPGQIGFWDQRSRCDWQIADGTAGDQGTFIVWSSGPGFIAFQWVSVFIHRNISNHWCFNQFIISTGGNDEHQHQNTGCQNSFFHRFESSLYFWFLFIYDSIPTLTPTL